MNTNKPTASEQLRNKKSMIRELMEKNVELRTDDVKLVDAVWNEEMPKWKRWDDFGFKELPDWANFRTHFLEGKLTSYDCVTRLARFIRKEKGWKVPKKEEEEKVKEQINEWKKDLFA